MRKILIFILIMFSAAGLYAENYFTLIAQVGSTPSSFAFTSNDVMYAGTLGSGVYKSDDYGTSWIQINNGLSDLNVYSLAVNPSGWIFAGTENGYVFYTSNNGSSWIRTNLNAGTKVKAIAINTSRNIFAGTNGNGIYRSFNNGSTWISISSPMDVYTLAIYNNTIIFAGTKSPAEGVYRSVNNGDNWVLNLPTDHNVNSIAINTVGTVYAATGNLETYDPLGDILARSKDTGNSWNFFYTFGSSSYGLVLNSLGHLFLGRYRCVWVSTNKGESWEIQNSGLELEHGILISYGVNSQGFVYAGQEGGYIYRTTYNTIGVIKISENIPQSFNLYQNYPNPFNPATTIKFDLPAGVKIEKSNVKIEIYNILGEKVAEVLNQNLSQGSYSVNWDASSYPSGVYLYRLAADNFKITKKMILMK